MSLPSPAWASLLAARDPVGRPALAIWSPGEILPPKVGTDQLMMGTGE